MNLESFPLEIKLLIIDNLSSEDWLSLCLTSKSFFGVIQDYLKDLPTSVNTLQKLIHSFFHGPSSMISKFLLRFAANFSDVCHYSIKTHTINLHYSKCRTSLCLLGQGYIRAHDVIARDDCVQFTFPLHGYAEGDTILLSGFEGYLAEKINGFFSVKRVTTDTISIALPGLTDMKLTHYGDLRRSGREQPEQSLMVCMDKYTIREKPCMTRLVSVNNSLFDIEPGKNVFLERSRLKELTLATFESGKEMQMSEIRRLVQMMMDFRLNTVPKILDLFQTISVFDADNNLLNTCSSSFRTAVKLVHRDYDTDGVSAVTMSPMLAALKGAKLGYKVYPLSVKRCPALFVLIKHKDELFGVHVFVVTRSDADYGDRRQAFVKIRPLNAVQSTTFEIVHEVINSLQKNKKCVDQNAILGDSRIGITSASVNALIRMLWHDKVWSYEERCIKPDGWL